MRRLLRALGIAMLGLVGLVGLAALLLWLTYVMLDVGHMQSGFTLPQSSY